MLDDLLPPPITETDPNAFEDLRAGISRAQRIRHFLALDLAEHVTQILRERGKKRRWLAQRLSKTDSELSKLLSGTHNLTLDSIAKLSDALEVDLLVSPRFLMGYFGSVAASVPAKGTVTHSGYDQAGGSLALSFKQLAQQAGDYSYAMAA